VATALAFAVLASGLAACSGQGQAASDHASIVVSSPAALADQPITIKVTGLAARQRVTVAAQATDSGGLTWRAQAAFTATADGVVNLASAAPASSSYQGADSMGLLWSMVPVSGDPPGGDFAPAPPQTKASFPVRLTVSSGGELLASRSVTREWMVTGEKATVLNLGADKVSGVLFTPRPGTPRHPGVLLFGGAEGGMSEVYAAALLAAHGYPALTVAYFDSPGLPSQLESIPMEYFATAGNILAKQPGVDPDHLLVMGYSIGSEAALLLADNFPKLFHGAIVYSPNSEADAAPSDSTQPAWTLGGKQVEPGPIAVNHISGPVLAIAGEDDALWGSAQSADAINAEVGLARLHYQHQALIYPDAGHWVGTFPYEPATNQALSTLGGSRAGDVAAQRSSWSKVLALLDGLGG
jgi:dienelactone hydrolase